MTTTAGVTIPSQRQVYLTKVQISSKDKSPRSKPKWTKSLYNKNAKSGSTDELHKTWGKSKDYAYVFTGEGDTKPWNKPGTSPPSKPNTFKGKQPKPKVPVDEDHHVYKIKEDGKTKVKKGTLVVSDKYFEAVKDERGRLLDLLNSLQKRNDVLEKENVDMVRNFETLHRENQQLRKKLDTGGEPVLESYRRVYDDRSLLREAENSYKNRLHKLEDELRISQHNFQQLENELRLVRSRNSKMSETTDFKGKYNKHYWDCYHLRAENEFLKATVKSLKEKVEDLSTKAQKGPQTAPVPSVKQPEQPPPPPPRPRETYGQQIKYVTLPEIDERRFSERKYGIY